MNYRPIFFNNFQERKDYLIEHFQPELGEDVISQLLETEFLIAPASTKYHGNYEGGLFDHSVNVAEVLKALSVQNKLEWESGPIAPAVVGLLHDLCKIDQYEYDEETGVYKFSTDPIVKGHGIKSVIYIQQLGVYLSEEDVACIIYHMGAFTEKEEWRDYTAAVNKYPNVLWTHTADMIASHVMGV